MTRALVFAANSFVGRNLCERLDSLGIKVTASYRATEDGSVATACDITDAAQVERIVADCKPDWVFQCAGATATGDPQEMYRLHVGGTLHVLDAIHRNAPEAHVVLLGSAAEYGSVPPESLPVQESHPCVPTSFFGASKYAQTEVARVAANEWGLRVSTVRPFNVIGPGLPPYYFATSLACRLMELDDSNEKTGNSRIPFPVTNADATRDFVDVRDVADALIALVERATPPAGQSDVINVATGSEVTIFAAAKRLAKLAGGHCQVIPGENVKSRSSIQRSCGDATKLRERTGWRPKVSWERSLEDLWKSLKHTQRTPT